MKTFFANFLLYFSMLGCTFAVPQVQSSMSFFGRLFSSQEAAPQQSQATWLGKVGGYGSVLSAFSADGFIVFANEDGDAIAFDGWTVRSITGFGLDAPVSIVGRSSVRSFVVGNVKSTANCDPWIRTKLGWYQSCSNGDGEITLDSNGNIQSIRIHIGSEGELVQVRLHAAEQ